MYILLMAILDLFALFLHGFKSMFTWYSLGREGGDIGLEINQYPKLYYHVILFVGSKTLVTVMNFFSPNFSTIALSLKIPGIYKHSKS